VGWQAEEFLEDVVREHPSARSETNTVTIEGEQTILGKPRRDLNRLLNHLAPKFARESCNVNASIGPET
jgi:hypothetical protein